MGFDPVCLGTGVCVCPQRETKPDPSYSGETDFTQELLLIAGKELSSIPI